jgi:mannose-6-phosphate isomerase-like protein (cupin superfamily)
MTRQHSKRRPPESAAVVELWSHVLLAAAPEDVPPEMSQRVKRELAARVSAQRSAGEFVTIRADAAGWIALTPLIDIKPLARDGAVYSFLMRMQPGARLPAHDHADAEECLVLSGQGQIGDTVMRAGDYQFARKGTRHGISATEHGVLLYIRGNCPALDRAG